MTKLVVAMHSTEETYRSNLFTVGGSCYMLCKRYIHCKQCDVALKFQVSLYRELI